MNRASRFSKPYGARVYKGIEKMETETINKLFLELSQITTAKTKRELELEDAIKTALSISTLWLPKGEVKPEHWDEARALSYMYYKFESLVDWPENKI